MKNKKAISNLAKKSFKANKLRNIFAVIGIILTTMMFTSIFTIVLSMSKSMEQSTMKQVGLTSHISFKNITNKEYDIISSHPLIKESQYSVVVGVAENPELKKRQTEIYYKDDNAAESSFSYPSVGNMPKGKNEFVTDTLVLDALSIPHEIGQKITFKWRENMNSDKYIENEFILSGYYEGDKALPASNILLSKSYIDEHFKGINQEQQRKDGNIAGIVVMDVMLKSNKNLEESTKTILSDSELPNIQYGVNWAYTSSLLEKDLMSIVPVLTGLILIFFSGYLIIYNIFQISVVKDIKFYGLLKTIGTTTKQIKKILIKQALILSLIGIPIGLILGYGIGFLILPFVLSALGGSYVLSSSPVIFIGSAIFSIITVMISCSKPAVLAGKVSPIEALRYIDSNDKNRKSIKKSRNGAKLFKMAYSNLGRNKKRTAIVVCSISLGLILLNCIYSVNKSFDVNKYLSMYAVSDFSVSDISLSSKIQSYNNQNTTINNDLLEEIKSLKGLENMGNLYYHDTYFNLSKESKQKLINFYEVSDQEAYDFSSNNPAWVNAYDEMKKSSNIGAAVFGLDEWLFSKCDIYKGNFELEKFKTGKYVLVNSYKNNGSNSQIFNIGDKVNIDNNEYEVMGYIEVPTEMSSNIVTPTTIFSESFVLPSSKFIEVYPDLPILKTLFDMDDKYIDETEQILRNYQKNNSDLYFSSRNIYIEEFKESTLATTIMGQTLSVVMCFTGILNFVNSMITAVISRKREFAMLQSIGMTKKQLKTMVVAEGLYYSILILLTTFIFGFLATEIGVKAYLADSWTSTYKFTILPIIACTPVIIILSALIPYLCFVNLEKQSIIERLRDVE
ncbi:ABC transporter permease [Clostridioides difficile]